MRMTLATLAVAALLGAAHASAQTQDHLAGVDVAQARLHQAAQQRETNLATVDAFVTSPDGLAAIAALGADAARVRGSLSTLNDAELQSLASRVAALDADPVAGALTKKTWIWIAAIAVVATIIIIAVA